MEFVAPGAAGTGFAAGAQVTLSGDGITITGTHVASNPIAAGIAPPVQVISRVALSPPCTNPLTRGAPILIDRLRRESRRILLAIRLTLSPQRPDDDQYCCMLRRVG